MTNWVANGKTVRQIAIDDRGLQYGDGLFETIAIRGGEPRLWRYHLERLAKGCDVLGINKPDESVLRAEIDKALAANELAPEYALVKIIVSGGIGQRGYGRDSSMLPTRLIGAFPASPLPVGLFNSGVDVALCETRLASNSPCAGLKTLNRLEQVLARSEIAALDVFEGLTMDAANNVICGTMSNVFFVANKVISTPPLDLCGVAGVMRRHVIETLRAQNINVDIRPMPYAELDSVDEVLLSNSQFGLLPVAGCAEYDWSVGETSRRLISLLVDSGVDELAA